MTARGRSLVTRIVGSLFLFSVFMAFLAGAFAYLRVRDSLRESILGSLTITAALKEGELRRMVAQQREAVEVFGRLPDLRRQAQALVSSESGLDRATARTVLSSTLARSSLQHLGWREVLLLNAQGGKVEFSTEAAHEGDFRYGDQFFTEGKRGNFLQNVYPWPVTLQPTLTIATPVVDEARKTIAVLAVHLSLDRMDEIVSEGGGLGKSGETYLVDRYNDFVSSRRFGRNEYPRGVHSEGVEAAVGGRNGSGMYLNYAGVPVVGVYRWLPDLELAMIAEVAQAEALAPARRLALAIAGGGLGLAALLMVGSYLLARRIARPILAIKDTALAVAEGNLEAVAPVLSSDEVGVLARAFNEMTSRLRSTLAGLERELAERKRTEAALRDSEQAFRTIFDASPLSIFLLDRSGRIVDANHAAEALLHSDKETLRGRLPGDLGMRGFAMDGAESDLRHLDSGEREPFEVLRENPDGTALNLLTLASAITLHDDCFLLLFLLDVTDRKRLEEERLSMERQLLHTQKLESLGVLAGGVAHDFNNLLLAMLGNLDIALLDLPQDVPARRNIERAGQAASRAADLTRQMLAYSGKGKFVVQEVQLADMVSECAQLLRTSIPRTIEFHLQLNRSIPPIKADPGQIEQVVMNLITNASEAIGAHPGTITLSTGFSRMSAEALRGSRLDQAPPPGDFSWIEVVDTGCGMDEPTSRRLFEPFFTTKFTGRGLGMSAVLGILRGHQGAIFVDSEPGVGTRMRVLFPALHAGQEAAGPPVTAEERAAGPGLAGGTVLVVDDEEIVREVCRDLVLSLGMKVLTAVDGEEAVRIASDPGREITCVILDLTMPRMNGAVAFERLQALRPGLPVILSSGYNEQSAVQQFTARGLSGFIQKPYTLELIRETLTRALHREKDS
jgi:PAS domain S-box-containing protein